MGGTEARMKQVYLSLALSYPRSTVRRRAWLRPAFNLRALYFNFPDVAKVAAFVAAMLLLLPSGLQAEAATPVQWKN